MKYENYVSLIKRLETFAAAQPRSYKTRVIALGLLGYAYFVFVAGATIALPLGAVALVFIYPKILLFLLKGFVIKLAWILVVFGIGLVTTFWSAIRSLFVKLPAPEGLELSRESAPRLFAFVDKASETLQTPLPTHVLLNDEFNASVVNITKFGFFGRKTYLNVGLPLMQALSPEQFKAVVAHEMGHLSENHGKYAAWIYRLHETWGRFLTAQESSEQSLSFLYSRFLNWYFPYFSAYAFVLRREHEREADRCSVQIVGVKHAGEALVNAELKASQLQNHFWREILQEAATSPKPPLAVFSRMATAFRQPNDSATDILTLAKALAIRTDYNDPHPCLADRLHEIGYWQNNGNRNRATDQNAAEEFDLPTLPDATNDTAANFFLGKQVEKLADQFDRDWQVRVAENWRARHDYLQTAEKRLAELEAKVAAGEKLVSEELYERAGLISDLKGNTASLSVLREIVAADPEDANANYTLGSILLDNGDEAGVEFVKKAMQINSDFELAACEQIFGFLQARGRETEAKVYLDRAEELYEIYSAARKERESVTDRDVFEHHKLPAETVEQIRQVAAWHEEIKAAYLVRKQVKHLPERPCHVLCLEIRTKWKLFGGGINENDLLDAVVNQVGQFDIDYVLILNRNFAKTKKQVEKIFQAKIYSS